VEDHVRALVKVVFDSELVETHNVGGHYEYTNLHVVGTLCDLSDVCINPKPQGIQNFRELITFVTDRSDHDKQLRHRRITDRFRSGMDTTGDL
jgi:dTDP-glucose 4,6-dehydratase